MMDDIIDDMTPEQHDGETNTETAGRNGEKEQINEMGQMTQVIEGGNLSRNLNLDDEQNDLINSVTTPF